MDVDRLPGNLPILWRVWGSVFEKALVAGPTPGHRALAALEATILTQNVDGLHQFAGSHDVTELHGSAAEAVCLNHACPWRAHLAVQLDHSRDASEPEH